MCKQTNALIPAHDKFTQNLTFSKFYFDVAEIYRRRWLEESGQRLENLDRTHLVLASGKPVLQKSLHKTYLYRVSDTGSNQSRQE